MGCVSGVIPVVRVIILGYGITAEVLPVVQERASGGGGDRSLPGVLLCEPQHEAHGEGYHRRSQTYRDEGQDAFRHTQKVLMIYSQYVFMPLVKEREMWEDISTRIMSY